MQTTITIPNPIYEAAEQLPEKLDLLLSDLSIALTACVTPHKSENVTDAFNRVYEFNSSAMDDCLMRLQLASIGGEE